MEQNRLKSPVLWVGVAALIAFVAKTWIGFEIPGWDEFINLLLPVLAGFSIINNPTNKNGL